MRRRSLSMAVLGCVAALVATACGGGGGSEGPAVGSAAEGTVAGADAQALGGDAAVAAMQGFYKAATDSGKTTVTVYGPGEEDKKAIYEIFSQRFPDIEVNGVYLVGPEFDAKIQAEFASGQHVADVIQSGDTTAGPYIGEKKIVPFQPVTAEGLDVSFTDGNGHVAAAAGSTFGILYNTNLLPADQAPKGWADLADPRFKGKMTSEDPTRNGGAFGTLSHLLWDGRYDDTFLKGVAGQGIAIQASGPVAATAVATGEYAIDPFYPLSFYQRDKAQGAPVGFVYPTEGGVHISPHYIGLLDGAPNPDAAKLLITWLFSPEAQQAVADIGYYPLMPNGAAPEGYPTVDKLDLLKPFPIMDVTKISSSNLARVKAAFGAAG